MSPADGCPRRKGVGAPSGAGAVVGLAEQQRLLVEGVGEPPPHREQRPGRVAGGHAGVRVGGGAGEAAQVGLDGVGGAERTLALRARRRLRLGDEELVAAGQGVRRRRAGRVVRRGAAGDRRRRGAPGVGVGPGSPAAPGPPPARPPGARPGRGRGPAAGPRRAPEPPGARRGGGAGGSRPGSLVLMVCSFGGGGVGSGSGAPRRPAGGGAGVAAGTGSGHSRARGAAAPGGSGRVGGGVGVGVGELVAQEGEQGPDGAEADGGPRRRAPPARPARGRRGRPATGAAGRPGSGTGARAGRPDGSDTPPP